MTNQVILDMDGLVATKSFDGCLKMCEQMKLIETMEHGDHLYSRLTQKGVNVMCTLLQLASNSSNPENRLKAT